MPNNEKPALRRSDFILAIVLALITLWPVVRWPGDVSWCIDEPWLVANAWHSNADRQLTAHGLFGNFGVCYSPVPTQIYQGLLAITHDPLTFVVLRGLLTATITGFSLLWLARTLRLPPWFAAALLIAPSIVRYHRVCWDASFTIPFGTLALAAFADFLATGRKWPLRIALAAAFQTMMIHPQAIPLCLPIVGAVLYKHRLALWRDVRGLVWTAGVLLIFNGKYLLIALGILFYRLTTSQVVSSYPKGDFTHLDAALAPFLGGSLLNGYDHATRILRPDGPEWLVLAAMWAARLAYPLIWAGIAVAAVRFFRRRGKPSERPVRDSVANVMLAGLVVQAALYGVLRIPSAEQYFFGTFAMHAFFAWLAVDAAGRWAALPGGLYGLACAFVTLGGTSPFTKHVHGSPSWPTLEKAISAVHMLDAYGDTIAYTDIEEIQRYPQGLRTLRLFYPPPAGRPISGRLLITWRERDGKKTGELVVIEMPTPPPSKQIPINVTPLPRDWVPDPALWYPSAAGSVKKKAPE